MNNELLFTKAYLDEGMPKLLLKTIKEHGFDVLRAEDMGNSGFTDEQQLQIAINLERTFITDDKKTFISDSGALLVNHFGIIIITKQISKQDAVHMAKEIIGNYLNRYAKDEWKNLIVKL